MPEIRGALRNRLSGISPNFQYKIGGKIKGLINLEFRLENLKYLLLQIFDTKGKLVQSLSYNQLSKNFLNLWFKK